VALKKGVASENNIEMAKTWRNGEKLSSALEIMSMAKESVMKASIMAAAQRMWRWRHRWRRHQ
jgi:hypothetical protein